MEKVYVLIDGEGKMKDCVVSLHRSKAEAEEAKKELNEICLGGRVCYIIESEIEPLKQDTASNSAPPEEPLCIECDGTGIVNYREIYYSFEHVEPVTCPACKDYKKQ